MTAKERHNEQNKFLTIMYKQALSSIKPQKATEFKPGAILYSIWGYEQTNVDFYCVVNIEGTKKVTAIPMTSEVTKGKLEDKNLPGEIDKTKAPFSRFIKEDNDNRKYLKGCLGEFEKIRLWDGKVKKSTNLSVGN